MDKNISFIGAGNMGRAIVNGLLVGGVCDCEHIKVCDLDYEKVMAFKTIGVSQAKTIKEAAEFADYIFVAVKPQGVDAVVAELAECNLDGKVIVTIAAGVSTEFYVKGLKKDTAVIRVMPNTPMLIGKGAAGICKNRFVSDESFNEVVSMFKVLGAVATVDESLLNPVISVSGSSPAYVYLFIKTMMNWATAHGFDEKQAKELVCASVIGGAEMILQSDKTPDELIRAVCSPGGTTLAAMAEFEKLGFENTISVAMDACEKRAGELSK